MESTANNASMTFHRGVFNLRLILMETRPEKKWHKNLFVFIGGGKMATLTKDKYEE